MAATTRTTYMIARWSDAEGLAAIVNNLALEGWVPSGGVCSCPTAGLGGTTTAWSFYQALVRKP